MSFSRTPGPFEFSLFYFAQDADDQQGKEKYRLLLEGAKFADQHGLRAIWTPERHFHPFGGAYPNPSVTSAAIAVLTERLEIRAGSVVLPIQDPLRVAEEWAVVDNLSNGRVSIAFASGAAPDDFVFQPGTYPARKEHFFRNLELVRKIWRGERVDRVNGEGKPTQVQSRPRPVQPELPFWITTAGSPETFKKAGELGAGLLTHLLGQDLKALKEKIVVYRESYRAAGHPGSGRVALMLHAFVHEEMEVVRAVVREPFREYLKSSFDLLQGAQGAKEVSQQLTPEDKEALIDYGYDRYFSTGGLFGTPETCLAQVKVLRELGVDEAACLIDFGIDVEMTLSGLEYLRQLMVRVQSGARTWPASP